MKRYCCGWKIGKVTSHSLVRLWILDSYPNVNNSVYLFIRFSIFLILSSTHSFFYICISKCAKFSIIRNEFYKTSLHLRRSWRRATVWQYGITLSLENTPGSLWINLNKFTNEMYIACSTVNEFHFKECEGIWTLMRKQNIFSFWGRVIRIRQMHIKRILHQKYCQMVIKFWRILFIRDFRFIKAVQKR